MKNKYKIALGMNLQSGAFGGGNQFGKNFTDYFRQKNITVVHDLNSPDIDLIFLTETRKWLASCAFDLAQALKYLKKHPQTLLITRINECDERKGERIKILNKLLLKNIQYSDQVIFISQWLENLFGQKNNKIIKKSRVIINGADQKIFNSLDYQPWIPGTPLKIVTHHWGANWNKGFDVYLKLDQLIKEKYSGQIEFTYIGNLPKNVRLLNSQVQNPKNGKALAEEIKKRHIYLTGSVNEPAGMHHIEGALCGLPILYRRSGALPEYCSEFGIGFNGTNDFEQSLEKMMKQYDFWRKKMPLYQQTAEKMNQEYYQLIIQMLEDKKELIRIKKSLNYGLISFLILSYILKIKNYLID